MGHIFIQIRPSKSSETPGISGSRARLQPNSRRSQRVSGFHSGCGLTLDFRDSFHMVTPHVELMSNSCNGECVEASFRQNRPPSYPAHLCKRRIAGEPLLLNVALRSRIGSPFGSGSKGFRQGFGSSRRASQDPDSRNAIGAPCIFLAYLLGLKSMCLVVLAVNR